MCIRDRYTTMIFVMLEQGIITADDNYRARIVSGELSPLEIIIDKLRTGDLAPAETHLNPCSGCLLYTSKAYIGRIFKNMPLL